MSNLLERAPLQRRSGYSVMLQPPSTINSLVCMCLCCVVNVCYTSTLCTLRFLLTSNGDKTADEAIGVKKGGIYVVFQPPFYQYK